MHSSGLKQILKQINYIKMKKPQLLKISFILILTLVSFSSCIKDKIEDIVWETDSHFTDGHKGSYTFVFDIGTANEKTYSNLKDDIIMTARLLVMSCKVSADNEEFGLTSAAVPNIGETKTLGDCDDCCSCIILADPEVGAENYATLTFVATGGTVTRHSKDKIVYDALMTDNGVTRTLKATIYIGAITLDAN
jgi:hypothetical protein